MWYYYLLDSIANQWTYSLLKHRTFGNYNCAPNIKIHLDINEDQKIILIDDVATGSAYCNCSTSFYKIIDGKLHNCLTTVNYLRDKDFEIKAEIT